MMSEMKRLRGLTLMEALLFLGIAAVVIVGAFSLYNNASSSASMNQAKTELQTYIGGIKSLYTTQNDYNSVDNELVISAEIAPSSAVSGTDTLINPWGGDVVISGNTRDFDIDFQSIPQQACVSMMASGLIDQGTVVGIEANGGTLFDSGDPPTPADATAQCNVAGDGNNIIFTAR
mgnify:CR=1 FL=1